MPAIDEPPKGLYSSFMRCRVLRQQARTGKGIRRSHTELGSRFDILNKKLGLAIGLGLFASEVTCVRACVELSLTSTSYSHLHSPLQPPRGFRPFSNPYSQTSVSFSCHGGSTSISL